MEQLFSLDVFNYPCSDVSCEHGWDGRGVEEIELVGDKIVLLRSASWNITSLMVITRSDQNEWQSKILACFKGNMLTLLATEEDWIAVAAGKGRTTTVKLWQSDNFRQDISLPERQPFTVAAEIALKMPFLVICCSPRTVHSTIMYQPVPAYTDMVKK